MPPPPPALAGLNTGSAFEDLHFTIESTPPSMFDGDAGFLLSMGEPPHPELDDAIAAGDDGRVLAELARVRKLYSPSVTLNTAINRAIECEQLMILSTLLASGIQANNRNLQAAVSRGNIPLIARLMEELPGCINMVFENGHTVLTYAFTIPCYRFGHY